MLRFGDLQVPPQLFVLVLFGRLRHRSLFPLHWYRPMGGFPDMPVLRAIACTLTFCVLRFCLIISGFHYLHSDCKWRYSFSIALPRLEGEL